MHDTPLHDDQFYDQQQEVQEYLAVISEKELQTIFDESFIEGRDLGDEQTEN